MFISCRQGPSDFQGLGISNHLLLNSTDHLTSNCLNAKQVLQYLGLISLQCKTLAVNFLIYILS